MHKPALRCALMAGILGALLVAAGCGGSGSSGMVADEVFPMARIIEYVGDGHGGTKPMPDFVGQVADQVAPASVATRLQIGGVARKDKVQRRLISWFYVDPASVGTELIVTLQPAPVASPGDADLYVMEGRSYDYADGAYCLGYSDRLPDGGQPDNIVGGWAPDWVAFYPTRPSPYPAAQVAVYGWHTTPIWKNFYIEADQTQHLILDGSAVTSSIGAGQSDWYAFPVTAGNTYRITVTHMKGDPDWYVYLNSSTGYLDGRVGPGTGGPVTITPTSSGTCYVRVYAVGTTTSYSIQLASVP